MHSCQLGAYGVIENEAAVIAGSLWNATANPLPECQPLTDELKTRVAVIGAGFTGLSAALHLAERGIDTEVLEAETPGSDASRRNGGQVNPGLIEDPDQIEAKFGSGMGALETAAAARVANIIDHPDGAGRREVYRRRYVGSITQ